MSKRPPRTIPSDDYIAWQDGVAYQPHAGEAVQIVGRPSIADLELIWEYDRLASEDDEAEAPEALPEDADAAAQQAYEETVKAYLEELRDRREARNRQLDEGFQKVGAMLARHIVGWTWTDDEGQPIPYDRTPQAILALEPPEIYYLRTILVRGETAADRKNASSGSATGAPAKGRNRTART